MAWCRTLSSLRSNHTGLPRTARDVAHGSRSLSRYGHTSVLVVGWSWTEMKMRHATFWQRPLETVPWGTGKPASSSRKRLGKGVLYCCPRGRTVASHLAEPGTPRHLCGGVSVLTPMSYRLVRNWYFHVYYGHSQLNTFLPL